MITATTYTVVVQARDVKPGRPGPWVVRVFTADTSDALASSEHHDVAVATDAVFAAIRGDIATTLDRGIQFGLDPAASHDRSGLEAYADAFDDAELTDGQITAWLERVDELLVDRPDLRAHSDRNEVGEFAFSPGSCSLCRELADIDLQAQASVLALGDNDLTGGAAPRPGPAVHHRALAGGRDGEAHAAPPVEQIVAFTDGLTVVREPAAS